MTDISTGKRTDSGSRLVRAAPQVIYRALLDPEAVVEWRAPAGMRAEIDAFEPREGGMFRMTLSYLDTRKAGKTAENRDMVEGRFAELVPDRRVAELVEFESDDPAFSGTMTVVTTLKPVAEGTQVTIDCIDVPPGISEADHKAGIASTLENLAAFVEQAWGR